MDTATIIQLRLRLVIAEGKRFKPYTDTTGHVTIGIGRNLTDIGIFEDEVQLMLTNDITRTLRDVEDALPWWGGLDDVRQAVIVEIVFNMGLSGFLQFKNTIKFLIMHDWANAAINLMDSTWSNQVGQRANQLAQMMRTGVWVAA